MGCFLGSKVSALSHLNHLIRFSPPPPRVIFCPYLLSTYQPVRTHKMKSELTIPLLKSFWAVLLQGAPDPECEPVTHHGWCTAGLLAPLRPPSYSSSVLTIMSQPQWLPVFTLNSPLYLPGTISYLYLANSYSTFYANLNIIFSGKNFMRNP